MIQRVQSVYLFISCVLFALLMVFPVVEYSFSEPPQQRTLLLTITLYGFIFIAFLCSVFAAYAIFLFKNRKKQMKLCRVDMLLSILLIIVGLFNYYMISQLPILSGKTIKVHAVIPLINIILLYLAHHSIKKDDYLVRSVDRLR